MPDLPPFTQVNYPSGSRLKISSTHRRDHGIYEVTVLRWWDNDAAMVDLIFHDNPDDTRSVSRHGFMVIERLSPFTLPEFTEQNYPAGSRIRIASKTLPDRHTYDVTIDKWWGRLAAEGMVDVFFHQTGDLTTKEHSLLSQSLQLNAFAFNVTHRLHPQTGEIMEQMSSESNSVEVEDTPLKTPNPEDHPVGTVMLVSQETLPDNTPPFVAIVLEWQSAFFIRIQPMLVGGVGTLRPTSVYRVISVYSDLSPITHPVGTKLKVFDTSAYTEFEATVYEWFSLGQGISLFNHSTDSVSKHGTSSIKVIESFGPDPYYLDLRDVFEERSGDETELAKGDSLNPVRYPVGTKLKVLAPVSNQRFEVEVMRWGKDARNRSRNEVRLLFADTKNDVWVPSSSYRVLEVLHAKDYTWLDEERLSNTSTVPNDGTKEHIDDCVRFFELISEAKVVAKRLGFKITVAMK